MLFQNVHVMLKSDIYRVLYGYIFLFALILLTMSEVSRIKPILL